MAEELTAEEKAELAERRAEKERARKRECIQFASEAVNAAADVLGEADHTITDDERIRVMTDLRAAINHINEAS